MASATLENTLENWPGSVRYPAMRDRLQVVLRFSLRSRKGYRGFSLKGGGGRERERESDGNVNLEGLLVKAKKKDTSFGGNPTARRAGHKNRERRL